MSVLLTGGAGFIGSHTAVELLQSGEDVIILDDFSNSKMSVLERIYQIAGRKPKWVEGDTKDAKLIDRIMSTNEIDGVIHFAGFKCVPESSEKPLDYYRNNLDSALSVLEQMDKHDVHAFVFSSSATVYGNNEIPFVESMGKREQTNPYGATKSIIEDIARDFIIASPSHCVVSLRYFNPIGAHPSGLIGEDPHGVPNNLMPYIQQVAIGKREKLLVYGNDFNTPDGTGIRDYIHVVDLAKGHVAALDFARKNSGDWKINLGSGQGTSVLEMVQAFENSTGVEIPYEIVARRAGDIDEMVADATRAKELLGWQTHLTVADACQDAWNWQKNNPDGFPDENNLFTDEGKDIV